IRTDRMSLFVVVVVTSLIVTSTLFAQGQGGQRGAPQGGLPAVAGRGGAGPAPVPPKPVIANAKPVRSCESLATVALPNTTIESAAVDPNNAGICRIAAYTTHPPMSDKVRIWIAIPTANWNGRFMGTGGGGFSGGN